MIKGKKESEASGSGTSCSRRGCGDGILASILFFFLCIPCLTYGFVFYSLLLYPRKKWIRKGKINEAEYWGERVFAASHASRVAGIKCRKNLVR